MDTTNQAGARPGTISAPGTEPETSPRYPGWRVVAACFAIATFAWGFGLYGQGVFLVELSRLHGWSTSLISGATTFYYLLGAALIVYVNSIVESVGPKAMALGGVACLAVSVAALAIIEAPWQLFAAYAVMALGWTATSVGAITNILGPWFTAKRGLAISLALNGASFGGVAVLPALRSLVGQMGFTRAAPIAAAVMLVVLVPVILAWIDRPRGRPERRRDAGAAATPQTGEWTRGAALRSAHFWGVSGAFALAIMVQAGFLVHQIAFLEPSLGRGAASTAVSLTAVMAMAGRVGLGFVIDRLEQRMVTAVSLASQAVALVVLARATSAPPLFAACAVFGLSVGNVITLPALIVQREFEPASFGLLIGLSTAITQVIYAFGPGLIGVMRDATGGYGVPLIACAGLDLAAAAIMLAGRRFRRTAHP